MFHVYFHYIEFYALGDVFAVKRHYAVLPKSIKIFCLLLGITLRNNLLTVYNKVAYILFVCLSVHALTRVNILQ